MLRAAVRRVSVAVLSLSQALLQSQTSHTAADYNERPDGFVQVVPGKEESHSHDTFC